MLLKIKNWILTTKKCIDEHDDPFLIAIGFGHSDLNEQFRKGHYVRIKRLVQEESFSIFYPLYLIELETPLNFDTANYLQWQPGNTNTNTKF